MPAEERSLSRRRLLALGGVALAPAVLAACGTDEAEEGPSDSESADALNSVLAEQLAVFEMAGSKALVESADSKLASRFAQTRIDSLETLRTFVEEVDGEPTTEAAETATGESPTEALARQLEQSIETSLEALRTLDQSAYLQAIHRYTVEDAAALAALRSTLGEDVAPDSFVFGPALEGEG